MTEKLDRPADLKIRRTPRPSADERVDPVDYGQSNITPRPATMAPVTQVPVRRGRPRREVTVPFSTRLAPDVLELIDQAVEKGEADGTIRSVIEHAVRRCYANGGY